MKQLAIASGIMSFLVLLVGFAFKVLHWPGAAFMIIAGLGLLFLLFLPALLLVFLKKNQDQ